MTIRTLEFIYKSIASCEERLNYISTFKQLPEVILFEKLLKTEKLTYMALLNPKSTDEIFAKLFAKLDEILTSLTELGNEYTATDIINEGTYLDFCKVALEKRNNAKRMYDGIDMILAMVRGETISNPRLL
jgi:hypothetical protein